MAATVARTGTRTRHSGKGARERAAESEAMLADYVKGVRMSALVEKYGVSKATVERRLAAVIATRTKVTVESYREQQNALLDELAADHQRNLEAGTLLVNQGSVPRPDPFIEGVMVIDTAVVERGLNIRSKALEGLLKVAERRHKLNGTDAPVTAQVEVTQVTPQEKELRDLLAAAAAAQAAREATLLQDEEA